MCLHCLALVLLGLTLRRYEFRESVLFESGDIELPSEHMALLIDLCVLIAHPRTNTGPASRRIDKIIGNSRTIVGGGSDRRVRKIENSCCFDRRPAKLANQVAPVDCCFCLSYLTRRSRLHGLVSGMVVDNYDW